GLYDDVEAKAAAGTLRVIGDKIVAKPQMLQAITANFESPRFVFVYRDLARVASSLVMRPRDPKDRNWPETKTYRSALAEWHRSFIAMLRHVEATGGDDVFVVRYERLFGHDEQGLRAMFVFLGLDCDDSVLQSYKESTAGWEDRVEQPLEL